MRYPVSQNAEDFKNNWYIPDGGEFGHNRGTYRHNGVDLNLKSGSNTDLGQPIFAIAKGKLTYYHKSSHPTTTYGYHNVYRIDGPWGTRWVHQAHCLDDLIAQVKDLEEGEQVAKIGKSGTKYAHVHFSIFKVDPGTLPNGIDTVAKNNTQLRDWWEDPIEFIEKWMSVSSEKMSKLTQEEEDKLRRQRDENHDKYIDEKKKVEKVTEDLKKANDQIGDLLKQLEKINEEEKNATELLIEAQQKLDPYKDTILQIKSILGLTSEATLSETVAALQELKDSKTKYKSLPKTFMGRLMWLLKGGVN